MTKKHTHQKDKTPETQAEQLSEQENEITSETNLTAEKVIVDMSKVENPQTDAEPTNTKLNGVETMSEDLKNTEKNNRTSESKSAASKAENIQSETAKPETVVIKKGGSGLALLAILIALGLGGAGYYFGQQHILQTQQKLTALQKQIEANGTSEVKLPPLPNFDEERAQLVKLNQHIEKANQKIELLEKNLSAKDQAYNALQAQINKLNSNATPSQPNDWLLSEADFLLTNALRKLVLDNDVETGIALLKVADEALAKVSDPRAVTVRSAIGNDLKQLLSVNDVDQNAIMQRLSQLANDVDDLVLLDVDFGMQPTAPNGKVTDNVADWESNIEKNAVSFLNHFIRITPRASEAKPLLAPNQDIYLRENIRLRLQIAIMAVPRQQNELYKQSLEAVASWVRSYFDTSTESAVNYLKALDELAEQSIYVDVPHQLSSLDVLDKILNKQPQEMPRIEISADKELRQETTPSEKQSETESKPPEAQPQQ